MKIKRATFCSAVFLALSFLFTGCRQEPSASGSGSSATADVSYAPLFQQDELPKLDGSTANIPMATLMVQRLLGISADQADALIDFSTTPNAYLALIEKKADLLLVYEADETIKEQIKESKVQLEYHPIGYDALVFLTNDGNPVSSLTTKEIQDIYQGKITNWQAVGGEDKAIEAYQRPQNSGSQALLNKLVMKDLPLMEAPADRYPGEMGGLIDILATYKNTANSLGYSVYYYAQNMYNLPDLKLLQVDGIAPTNETISDKSYPFINEFYAVIRKNEPENSQTRQLLNWILSDAGKQTVRDAGYVSA